MNTMTPNVVGKGPSFPLNISSTKGLEYTENITRINHSLFILFNTPKGSRLMLPEFGSDIHKYRFDPLDDILMERLRYTITEDVKRWEPRISLTGVDFLANNETVDNSVLYIYISYYIRNTDIHASYVYPYKLNTYDTLQSSYN